MKVIDLLNKIANGEDVPKKIKFNDLEYEFNEEEREYQRHFGLDNYGLGENVRLDIALGDEVEVIEEDKKISKDIKWYLIEEQEKEKTKIAQINMNFRIIREKMGEIIDKINEGE